MRHPKRPRRYTTVKLLKKDLDLIRVFYKQSGIDRYLALAQLTPFVEGLTEDELEKEPSFPIRIGLPIEVDAAIRTKASTIERPFVRVLLAAIRKWSEKKRGGQLQFNFETPPLEDDSSYINYRRQYTCDGETHTVSEWAERLGRSTQLIYARLQKYPPEIALHIGRKSNDRPSKATVRYTYGEETLTVAEWAKRLGMTTNAAHKCFRRYPVEEVINGTWRRWKKQYIYDGESHTITEWAKKLDIKSSTLRMRLRIQPPEIALAKQKNCSKIREIMTYNGESHSIKEWAKKLDILPESLIQRLKVHPLEIALSRVKYKRPKNVNLEAATLCYSYVTDINTYEYAERESERPTNHNKINEQVNI